MRRSQAHQGVASPQPDPSACLPACCSSAHNGGHMQESGDEAGAAARAFWEGGSCLAGLSFVPPACWGPLLQALAQPLLAACHSKASSSGGLQLSPTAIAAAAAALVSGEQATMGDDLHPLVAACALRLWTHCWHPCIHESPSHPSCTRFRPSQCRTTSAGLGASACWLTAAGC